jgi:hypothetical protein
MSSWASFDSVQQHAVHILQASEARDLTAYHRTASDTALQKLLQMVTNKVRFFATMGRTFTLWQVPPIIADAPVYDRDQAAGKLAAVLTQAGYLATVLSNCTLFVAWRGSC